MPRSLVALLTAPGQFFDRHPPQDSLLGAVVVVAFVSLVTTVGVGIIGWLLASNIDATYTETVMEPRSGPLCDPVANMTVTPEACGLDEPRTRQVDVGAELWDAFAGRLPLVFFSGFLGWVMVAVGLHLASAMAGGEGSFTATLAVAGWGMVPGVLQTVVGVAAAAVVIPGMEFASDPAVLAEQLRGMAPTTFGFWGPLAGVVATAWQAYVWGHGLRYARDLTRGGGFVAAGAVGLLTLLFSLL
jgi:hypothetical protein